MADVTLTAKGELWMPGDEPAARMDGERVDGERVDGERVDVNAFGPGRLIPALPPGPYVIEPEDIDRFYVSVQEDGTIFFKGNRARIEEFLRACEEIGLGLRVNHIAFCG